MTPEEHAEAPGLLRSFERRFLAGRVLRSFPWQTLEEKLRGSSDSELLLDILQKTVKHPVCVKHPPSVKYVRCFLSELIKKHEAVHAEPLDELYEALAEVLAAEETSQAHRSYLLPSGDTVTLCESTAIISHGTTGLVTWNAALYLVEWAIENPVAFTSRTVLELGSGAGFAGLAICKVCHPRTYIFSDCHSRVLEQLRGNILLNGFLLAPMQPPGQCPLDSEKPTVRVAQLDWDLVTGPQLSAFQPDTVIAAGTAQPGSGEGAAEVARCALLPRNHPLPGQGPAGTLSVPGGPAGPGRHRGLHHPQPGDEPALHSRAGPGRDPLGSSASSQPETVPLR
ncbi:protein-lysine N-methyltransferase EEF2KMT isoform X2 [Tamandua tetradactyla]|uniref:protein-lysine N-methyltransferase EEF2KMT isoform X2 n=1 Tax=Tamandua tetradactyla TaxID=48850 RepID=UPI004053FC63